jgi:YD repeat-containing protein
VEYDRLLRATPVDLDPLGREVSRTRLAVSAALYGEGLSFPSVLPELRVSLKAYDAFDRVSWEADAEGHALAYAYDGANRVLAKATGLLLGPDASAPATTPATAEHRREPGSAATSWTTRWGPRWP